MRFNLWKVIFTVVAIWFFLKLIGQLNLAPIALILAIISTTFWLIWVLFQAKMLPEVIMDWLEKLTNKDELREALVEQERQTKRIDPDEMKKAIKSSVIGQDVAVDQLVDGISRRIRQRRRGKPVFTMMLSGPTGTGKTELAKAAAKYLFGSEKAMFRIDCGQMESHGISSLIGSPKGYAGSQEWGTLTKHLKTQPDTLILFDEIEKAGKTPDTPLYKVLLSLLDEGRVTEQSTNTVVDATQAVIMLTSNAQQEKLAEIYERYKNDPDQLVRATKDQLQNNPFAPELLGRLDLVTTVSPLAPEDRAAVCAMHVWRLASSYNLEVTYIDPDYLAVCVGKWTELGGYGVREVIRWIERNLGDSFIEASDHGKEQVSVNWNPDTETVSAT